MAHIAQSLSASAPSFSSPGKRSRPAFGRLAGVLTAGCVSLLSVIAQAAPPTSVDLSTYVRVGRFDLPEPTRTAHPANSLLAQEASSVTYNWDTDTLFVVGDGGTSVVQVSKTGQLINSMTLALGGSPQGTEFYDTEGITYIGGGQFVLIEERYRQANLFTYVAGGTLQRSATQTVKLGTTIGNVGLEGLCYDPQTGGFIFVKEKDPLSVFQTTINFPAGTASNGSPTATSSTDLFNPALANLSDFSDVFALSNLPSLAGQPDSSHLLIISQESGQIVNIDRNGNVSSRLTIVADPGSPLTVPDMTMEGVTMDRDGFLYVANENGGGDANHPQLWVYAPSTAPNLAPTAVALSNQVASIPENTSTAAAVKVADIIITDDGLGNNNLTVTGADANSFQIIGVALFLKAGTPLSSTTKPSYSVAVSVDDPAVGGAPDATSSLYTLSITPATGGTPSIIVSEVAPWSSGNSVAALRVDWFEVTNVGTAAQNIAGWKMDDNSNSAGSAVALNGITSIAPGESVIFLETADNLPATVAAKRSAFLSLWFGTNPPPNLQVGTYSGAGVGLSTATDAVNVFNAAGVVQARVDFNASPAGPSFPTFDNAAGLNNVVVSNLAAAGINGAFRAVGDANEVGSPGTIGAAATPVVTIAATDASAAETGSNSGSFRITRSGSTVGSLTVNYTISTGAGQATNGVDYTQSLTGVATIASGQSFVEITITPVDDTLIEETETVTMTLGDTGSYDVGTPATATVTITDNDPANVSLRATSLNLAANVSPAGGTFSGPGVTAAGVFDPSAVGPGTYSITYTFDGGSTTFTVTVTAPVDTLTVAAGDVTQTSAVLWAHSAATGSITLVYSTDATFATGVTTVVLTETDLLVPAKTTITGLTPNTSYYYRATSGATSASGQFWTPPNVGTFTGLRFGVSGDERGELAPYPSIGNAAASDLDFFVQFGDNIYADFSSPDVPAAQSRSLTDFRTKTNEVYAIRYGLNTFSALRSSTAILATIDDHEVTDNFAGAALRTSDSRFFSDTGTLISDTETFRNGLQAFREYHPVTNLSYGATGDVTTANRIKNYRFNTYGSDAATFLLDARSFRSEHLPPVSNPNDQTQVTNFIVGAFTSGRTMLGAAQLADLKQNLLDAQAAGIVWKLVLCPEPIQNFGPLGGEDRYEGYAAERTNLLKFIDDHRILNVLFVTADFHGTVVNRLSYQMGPGQPQIQTKSIEIITGSVAFDKPFGPTIVDLAIAAGLAAPGTDLFYQTLSSAAKESLVINNIVNPGLAALGYNQISLTSDPLPNVHLVNGLYTATNTYGWTEFNIDSNTHQLDVKTWGIAPYTKAQLDADPAGVTSRVPAVVSEFVVTPEIPSIAPGVTVTRGGFVLDRRTGRFVQSVTVRNAGTTAITSPLSLVLDSLSVNASLDGAAGTTANLAPLGSPYVFVPVGSDNALTPGESVTIVLNFVNPTRGAITYDARVVTGTATP
ncbi:MAG: alkaline phosphatase D family protein [Chthoniobacteraceae bacterium]